MILRPRPHWLRMLFLWRGTVLRKLLPRLLLIFVVSVLALLSHPWLADPGLMDLSAQPFTLLGVALAIFLSFRTNVAHERYWEARKLWGQLLVAARGALRQALSNGRWQPGEAAAKDFAQTLAACAHALRHQLRDSDPRADLARLMPAAQVETLARARHPAVLALQGAALQLRAARERGEFADVLLVPIQRDLDAMGEAIGGCERIAGTPIPLAFSVMVHRTVYFYCLLVPFALIPSIGWYTPVFTVFLAYAFMALEAIAEELEMPFGLEPNDLPLAALCETIEASLREQLGEAVPPAPPIPADYIVR